MDLDDVNDYFVRTSLWPAIVYTIVTMVIGLIGNGLVLIIYRKDYQKNITWVFVYYLAVLDMLSCLISMPSELMILFNMMSFPSVAWCKISRYLTYLFHSCSHGVILLIAFNRYDRMCRLGNHWLNLKNARRICIGVFCFFCGLDLPTAIFHGDAKVKIAIQDGTAKFINEEDFPYNITNDKTTLSTDHRVDPSVPKIITGHMCLISSEYSDNILVMFFILIHFLMYCIVFVLVCFFYTKVIRKMVWYRVRQKKLFKLYNPNRNESIKEETSEGHLLEDVESDKSGKDLTRDPSNNTIPRPGTLKRSNNARQAVYETESDQKPTRVTDSEKKDRGQQKLANSVNINVAGSDVENVNNNLSKSSDHLGSNKSLSRRIRRVEVLDKTLPRVKGRDVTRKCCSDDNRRCSSDDVYLHKESHLIGSLSKSMEETSLSLTDHLNASLKTMTLNGRSHKGSSQCVLPVSGLSLKTVSTYGVCKTSNTQLPQKEADENGQNVSTYNAEAASGDGIETAETNPKTTSGDSENISNQDSNVSPGSKQRERGKNKLVSQPSVTYIVTDNTEEEESRRTARSKKLDSISTPDTKSPYGIGSCANSLSVSSEKTISYSNCRRMSFVSIRTVRTSMLLIISLAFILSFLPFWVIVIMRAKVGKSFTSSLNSVTLGCVAFLVRSTLVSNAVNPIVYGIINNQFRKRCKAIFQRK